MLQLINNVLIDSETGEIVNIEAINDEELSDYFRDITIHLKALQVISEKLNTEIKTRLSEGQTKFANFWDVQWIKDRFSGIDLKKLEEEDPDLVETLKKNYSKYSSYSIIKFPKY